MKYIVAGGGSGGHLTPLIAVASSLKNIDAQAVVIHIGQKGDNLSDITNHGAIDDTMTISAGKFRRYHGESLVRQLLDVKTLVLNIRDFFKFLIGVGQAWRLLGKVKPNAIFLKGGFVCVPVGVAARMRNIPYVTHDSDAVPGLANKLTAKHAVYNTTAQRPENYPYDKEKTIQVGIPIQEEYRYVTTEMKQDARKKLKLPADRNIILSVGGGLGARRLNKALVSMVSQLSQSANPPLLMHMTGRALFKETEALYVKEFNGNYQDYVTLIDFTKKLFIYSEAADIVISRAGATNIAEFAAQAKPCIFVPNPVLTGGQQLHNAAILEKSGAAEIVYEDKLEKLSDAVTNLLDDRTKQQLLSDNLHALSIDDSAKKIAEILDEIANSSKQ